MINFNLINKSDSFYTGDKETDRGIYIQIVDSEWFRWDKEVSNKMPTPERHPYDTAECAECGVISPEHLKACLEFLSK